MRFNFLLSVFFLSAFSVQANETLGVCRGSNAIVKIVYDSKRDPVHKNDSVFLEITKSGSKSRINAFESLVISPSDSRLVFSEYGTDVLDIRLSDRKAYLVVSEVMTALTCQLDSPLVQEVLGIDLSADVSTMRCVSRDDAQSLWSANFRKMFKNGISGGSVGNAGMVGAPDCAILSLHVVSTDELKQARTVYGDLFRGIPIQYQITGEFILQ